MLMTALIVLASAAAPMPASHPAVQAPASAPAANTICPVCGKSIEPGQGTRLTIRGREYAVDDKACSDELMANPDKYLDPDGTPKNAKR